MAPNTIAATTRNPDWGAAEPAAMERETGFEPATLSLGINARPRESRLSGPFPGLYGSNVQVAATSCG